MMPGRYRDVYALSQSGLPIGTVTVEWASEKIDVNDRYMRGMALFFHKMTGLPREDFPERGMASYRPPLGEDAKVSLDGGASLNVLFHMKERAGFHSEELGG